MNNSGKWEPGADTMGSYIFKGEIGDEDITVDEARALAEQLGGSVDD